MIAIKTNTFQIIGGEHRGRKFTFPDAVGLRPSPSKVRETLFNWIQFEIVDKVVLDLFTGSGALSFEALSRGAKKAISIEKNADAFAHLEQNKRLLKTQNMSIFHQDALEFLTEKNQNSFDFIFLDPPFYKNYLEKTLKLIAKNGFANVGIKIYIESEFAITPSFLAQNFFAEAIINKQKKTPTMHYCLIQL
ncbi:MAG: 16S rRNA (guanine(966)-N(2))-methyltransferase RsmD [Candidatus Thioglobus sp.]|nr:MAG: 16S rRNA (guanine(966)-N(2))-methyltransferase RsmD [Candidatus Thioglobus sp.]